MKKLELTPEEQKELASSLGRALVSDIAHLAIKIAIIAGVIRLALYGAGC
jgi:hypothetical protein